METVREILHNIAFPDYVFTVKEDNERMYLQAEYYEKDVVTGKIELQKTRKWNLSRHMKKSEIVQTAFKCVLTSYEHRCREHFLYKGERVFSPHFDVEALVLICKAQKFDERSDWYAEDSNTK